MRKESRSAWAILLALTSVVWLTGVPRVRADEPVVSLLTDEKPGPAASHGAEKLMAALRAKGVAGERAASLDGARGKFLIVAGRAEGGGPAARLLKAGKHPAPQGPEALVLRRTEWNGKPVWLIAGSDDRGVMYEDAQCVGVVRAVCINSGRLCPERGTSSHFTTGGYVETWWGWARSVITSPPRVPLVYRPATRTARSPKHILFHRRPDCALGR